MDNNIIPFFKDDIVTIYNNDFRNIINLLNFDYIITDPPYNVGYKYIDYNDKMSDEDYINMLSFMNSYKVICIHYLEEFCGNVGEALGIPKK
jgi:DNA modification methylase